MKSRWFYLVLGSSLVIALVVAMIVSARDLDREDVSGYPKMSQVEIRAELNSLQREAFHPATNPKVYFITLKRFERLLQAIKRFNADEAVIRRGLRGGLEPENDVVNLALIRDRYSNDAMQMVQQNWDLFVKVRDEAGNSSYAVQPRLPGNPLVPKAWALVYFIGLVLTFGRFAIEIEELGGSWWMSAITDWRFPFWLTIWFVGIFKYPMEIDVALQVRRAYRFAVLVLSSTLSLAAAGCAGKRVNTEPDEQRVDTAKTWQINTNTVTWPSYIGSNGAVFHSGPVQQTSVTATAPNGGYVGVWHSAPISRTDSNPNYGHEVDGSVGWSSNAGKTRIGTDLTWVDVVPLRQFIGDVFQLSGSVSRPMPHGLSMFGSVQLAMPARGDMPKRGLFLREGLHWGLSRGRFSTSVEQEIFHDSGGFGFNPGWLTRGNGTLGLQINDHWRAEMPARWGAPLNVVSDGRRKELQGGLSVAWQP